MRISDWSSDVCSSDLERMTGTASVPSYLIDSADQREGGIDVALSATIWTEKMRAAGEPPAPLLKTGSRYMYWTPAQMLAQHSITGCRLAPGDLIGTGTISGPTRADLASFFELSTVGKEPITLPNGETREFIDDGDEIALFGRCERGGFVSIGLDRKSTRLNYSH